MKKNFLKFIFVFMVLLSNANATQPITFFDIDASTRGENIYNLVQNVLLNPAGSYFIQNQSEVAIQTTLTGALPYAPTIVNGFIPFVQKVVPSTNNTLLIIWYLPNGSNKQTQYIVVPVEQIVSVIYSPRPITGTVPVVTSTFLNSTLPFISVDPTLRAVDIQNVVTTLNTTAPYLKTNQSEVWIQTTLTGSPIQNGPFYPTIPNGIIANVQSVSLPGGSLLTISYQAQGSNSYITSTIIATAEQVEQVIYFATNPGTP